MPGFGFFKADLRGFFLIGASEGVSEVVVAADPEAPTSGMISGILVNLGPSLWAFSKALSSSSVSDESVSPRDFFFSGSSSGVVSEQNDGKKF